MTRAASSAGPSDRPRLVVVGINYSPEPTGSGPYTAGLAEMASELGYDVSVLTGVPHYPTWRVPDGYRWRVRSSETVAGVPVRRLRHFVPRRQSALTRALWESSFLAQTLTTRLPARPDLIVASTPGLSGAVYGATIARRLGVPFGAVVQDVVGSALQGGVLGRAGRLSSTIGKVEQWALTAADQVAVVSPRFLPSLEKYGVAPDRLRVLANWSRITTSPHDRAEARRRLGWSADEFVVAHTGNMGLKQDLHTVIDAARLASDEAGVRFVLVGDGNQRQAVFDYADGLRNVDFLPSVDDDTYPLILAAADVLLISERASTGEMSLPSKLTSYLMAGRPVLAAVQSDGACALELAKTDEAGLVVAPSDPEALLGGLLTLRWDDARRQRMALRAHEYARAELGRADALRKVDRFLADLLHSATGSMSCVPAQRAPLPVAVR